MNKTKEYYTTSCKGIALLIAKSLYEKGEFYTSFLILKGLGEKVTSRFNYEFILGKKKINRRDGTICVIDTIYVKANKKHPWITEKEFNQF